MRRTGLLLLIYLTLWIWVVILKMNRNTRLVSYSQSGYSWICVVKDDTSATKEFHLGASTGWVEIRWTEGVLFLISKKIAWGKNTLLPSINSCFFQEPKSKNHSSSFKWMRAKIFNHHGTAHIHNLVRIL